LLCVAWLCSVLLCNVCQLRRGEILEQTQFVARWCASPFKFTL
jgi:hypothetical protein